MSAADSFPWAAKGERPVAGPDGYTLFRGDPYFAEHELLNRFYDELGTALHSPHRKPPDVKSGRLLLGAEPGDQVRLIHALLDRLRWVEERREKGPRMWTTR